MPHLMTPLLVNIYNLAMVAAAAAADCINALTSVSDQQTRSFV